MIIQYIPIHICIAYELYIKEVFKMAVIVSKLTNPENVGSVYKIKSVQ